MTLCQVCVFVWKISPIFKVWRRKFLLAFSSFSSFFGKFLQIFTFFCFINFFFKQYCNINSVFQMTAVFPLWIDLSALCYPRILMCIASYAAWSRLTLCRGNFWRRGHLKKATLLPPLQTLTLLNYTLLMLRRRVKLDLLGLMLAAYAQAFAHPQHQDTCLRWCAPLKLAQPKTIQRESQWFLLPTQKTIWVANCILNY